MTFDTVSICRWTPPVKRIIDLQLITYVAQCRIKIIEFFASLARDFDIITSNYHVAIINNQQ